MYPTQNAITVLFPVQLQQWSACTWIHHWQDLWKHSLCKYLDLSFCLL